MQMSRSPSPQLLLNKSETKQAKYLPAGMDCDLNRLPKRGFPVPVEQPDNMDVLLGRGRPICAHSGNIRLRLLVDLHRATYDRVDRDKKTLLSMQLVGVVKHCGTSPGRFLRFEEQDNLWYEVSDEVARKKVAHLFRQKDRDLSTSFARAGALRL